MSSERFETCEEDLRTTLEAIGTKIEEHIPHATGEARKKLIRDVQRQIEEGAVLAESLESEARNAPGGYRLPMMSKVRSYQKDIEKLRRELTKVAAQKGNSQYSGSLDTTGFFSPEVVVNENHDNSTREKLFEGTQILHQTSQHLERSHQIALETDEIGTGIIDDLSGQKEQLIRTRDRLEDIDANISHSRKVIRSIGKRIITSKLLLIFIIILEVIILGVVIYWKFFMHKT